MNRTVRVRRRKDVPLTCVYEGVDPRDSLDGHRPTYYLSRVWMGVVPAENKDPGYACVLGDVYNGDPRAHRRVTRLLDEAIALDPTDFRKRERRVYDIPDDALTYPTHQRLAQAVVTLKDLYWPSRVWVPPSQGADRGDVRPDPFLDFIRTTDGLVWYDRQYGVAAYRAEHPHFSSVRRVVDGVLAVPHEDREYNLRLVDSLLAANRLRPDAHCTLFLRGRWSSPRRAVGMVLYAMEQYDPTQHLRHMKLSDGYVEPSDDPVLEEQADALRAAGHAPHWRWWAGGLK